MIVTNLKCEYRVSPIGLDVLKPRLSWRIESADRGVLQVAYQIIVSSSKLKLLDNEGDLWDSKKVYSDSSIQIVYEGSALESYRGYYWKVRVWDKMDGVSSYSQIAYFEMGLLSALDWRAKWIGLGTRHIQKDTCAQENVGLPSPYLRHIFSVDKAIEVARVYASAYGVYELYLNGTRVGNDEYAPGWTDYHKRIQYQTYDVSQMLKQGDNVIGGIIGDGWYTGNVAITGRKHYGDYPLLLLVQLRIQYEDGTIDQIITDDSWVVNIGAIRYSDLQMGEYYDSSKELVNWSTIGYDHRSWVRASEFDRGYEKLVSQIGSGIKVMRELKPLSVSCVDNHIYIYDMGQNMVGRVLLKVRGTAGTKIQLRYGEMIREDGSLYTENLRTAAQTDIYILSGKVEETYEPRFTFHGFRYVEVTGLEDLSDIIYITGRVVHSSLDETMAFYSSNEMINQLHNNILWGQRGNFLSIPTDCPQRDERMGWTGDGQVFARTACFNMDSSSFFTKWMADLLDAQHHSGGFTDVAPFVKNQDGIGLVGYGNAAWGDAGIIIPWTLYQCYGDVRILEANFEAMDRHIQFLLENSVNFIRPDAGYGDWLSINADTPKDVMGTAYFGYAARLMANISRVIGRAAETIKYEELFMNIKAAFNNAFVATDGRIKGDTQTCYLLAIKMELLDEDKRILAAKHLVDNIRENSGHLTTGFVGVSYLLPVLTDEGYVEEAYKLILNETYPSWMYSIKNGATTIWERWNSYTREGGFGDVGMNSFNHYSLGSVGEWLYRYMIGIEADINAPGYKHFQIKPYIGGNLDYAKGEYHSIYGTIKCGWKIDGRVFCMNVTIPGNTTATLFLPYDGNSLITENKMDIDKVKEIKRHKNENGRAVLELGSGTYEFHCLL